MRDFGHLLGCHVDAKYRYRILTEDGSLRLRQIDVEEDVIDTVGIGKQSLKVELYIIHDFHIRSMDPSSNCSNVESKAPTSS